MGFQKQAYRRGCKNFLPDMSAPHWYLVKGLHESYHTYNGVGFKKNYQFYFIINFNWYLVAYFVIELKKGEV